ncbi:hypothetical protein KKA14_00500, partial [bacterium]|nr:hypothetical protein [bacterium]
MILYSVLLSISAIIVLILSFPVKLHFESKPVLLLKWSFLKVRIVFLQDSVITELKLFNRKLNLKRKKSPKKSPKNSPKPSPKKKKPEKAKKKPKKKITFQVGLEILQESCVKKILRILYRLVIRFMKSIKISFLKCNIGLNDYYWQGITMGLLSALPRTESFQVNGNFEEINDIVLTIKISLWRLVSAIVLFLLCFPYLRALL